MANDNAAWGLTPPISTKLPSEKEKTLNEVLIEELRSQNNFESASETEKRKVVLQKIESIGNEFVRRVAREKEHHIPQLVRSAICRLFTYGSYRLGVHGPGSDIDTLIIGPSYCTLEDFFKHMPCCLRELSEPGALESMAEVPDAFVPIIKLVYSGIEIDLIFARIATLKQLPSDPAWNLRDNTLLRGLNDSEVRAMNGTRVSDEIISLVPEPSTFRLALRAIKLWAQRRAIYGNIVGFPGGIAWALMVARVCQLYPKAPSSVIVSKFFSIMLQWPFPQPVLLKTVETGPLSVQVWNPKGNMRDGKALMPIITPAYPSMNSTFNISHSSLTVIKQELKRADRIASQIIDGTLPWKALFDKHTFFTKDYKYYMRVIACGLNKQDFKSWSGWVESRLRFLALGLERHESIMLPHAFIKGISCQHRCSAQDGLSKILNGSMEFVVANGDEGGIAKEEPLADTKQELPVVNAAADSTKLDMLEAAGAAGAAGVNGETEKTCKVIEAHTLETTDADTGRVANARSLESATASTSPTTASTESRNTSKQAGSSAAGEPEAIDIWSKTFYIGLEIAEGSKGLNLVPVVSSFRARCLDWDMFKKSLSKTCAISIGTIRNFDLPDDVFEAGETKPKRPIKSTLKRQAASMESNNSRSGKRRNTDGATATTAAAAALGPV